MDAHAHTPPLDPGSFSLIKGGSSHIKPPSSMNVVLAGLDGVELQSVIEGRPGGASPLIPFSSVEYLSETSTTIEIG